jgi:hypothetical protein
MANKVVNYKKIRTDIINGKKKCIYMKPKGTREYVKSKGEYVLLSVYAKRVAKIAAKKLVKNKNGKKKLRGGNNDNASSSSNNIIIITHPDGTREEGGEELFDNLKEGDKIIVRREDGAIIEAKYINTKVANVELGKKGFLRVLVNTSIKSKGDLPDYRGLQFAKAREHNKVTTRVKKFLRQLFNKEEKRKGPMDERLNRLLLSGKLFRTEKGSRSSSRSSSRRTGRSSSS